MLSLLIEESSCSSLGGIESVRGEVREYARITCIINIEEIENESSRSSRC